MPTPQEFGFAAPGESDLDFDVDNLTLTSLVVLDEELCFELRGGVGAWAQSGDVPVAEVPAAEELVNDVTCEVALELPLSLGTTYREWYLARLRRWEDDQTLLRLVSAPGRPSTLMEDTDSWVVIPRAR